MSRYHIPSLDPSHEVVVGWDNPLGTLWFHVYGLKDEDGETPIVAAFGDHPSEKTQSVESLAVRVSRYGTIPDRVKGLLRLDLETRTEPTPLQMMMRALFENNQED